MRVKNLNRGPDRACNCDSWVLHWVKYSGRPWPPCCSVRNCIEKAAVGAQAQIDLFGDNQWYIVPLCVWHNATRNVWLELSEHALLVPAVTTDACRRRLPVRPLVPVG